MRQRPVSLLVALLLACHAVAPATAADNAAPPCPQPRQTESAPPTYAQRANPLPNSAAHIERGRTLYQQAARPVACAGCHGSDGSGRGPNAALLVPPPRNFTCAQTMAAISDGQLFWIIENGSGQFHLPSRQGAQQVARPGRGAPHSTAMLAYGEHLTETDIWQLVAYIRTLSAPTEPKARTP